MTRFVVQPQRHHLLASGEIFPKEKLRNLLEAKGDIEPLIIRRKADILVDGNGKVQRRFQFTRESLSQICSIVAPGLGTLVENLAHLGPFRGKRTSHLEYSMVVAIEILNNAIQLRFGSRLAGRQLLVDYEANQIEGLVSPNYMHFSNSEFLDLCDRFVEESGVSPSLVEARLQGRGLVLRYKNDQDLFHLRDPLGNVDWFNSGWHFSNNEVTSAEAIRVGLAFVRTRTKRSAILEVGRLPGRGNLHRRFQKLLVRLHGRAAAEANQNLEECATKLLTMPLDLGGSETHHVKRFDELVKHLIRGGLRQSDARRILNHTLLHGSREDNTDDELRLMTTYQRRSGYDLFNGLISQSLECDRLETAEKLAYRLLTGQFNF